jgi:hypothetical protein
MKSEPGMNLEHDSEVHGSMATSGLRCGAGCRRKLSHYRLDTRAESCPAAKRQYWHNGFAKAEVVGDKGLEPLTSPV